LRQAGWRLHLRFRRQALRIHREGANRDQSLKAEFYAFARRLMNIWAASWRAVHLMLIRVIIGNTHERDI